MSHGCDPDVPVLVGYERPVVRPAVDASWFHGRDGLSDPGAAPSSRVAESTHVVDALLALSREHPGATLVTLGPLTNVAIALRRDPTLATRIGRCVVMGGNPCSVGDVTPAAECNVWCDPEAAEVVFASGLNVELVGWHPSRGDAVVNASEIDTTLATDAPLARFVVESNCTAIDGYRRQPGESGITLPDPIAMAVAPGASLVTRASSHRVRVECASELTRGTTVVDDLGVGGDERNAWPERRASRIVWTIDVSAFKRRLMAPLAPGSAQSRTSA